MYSAKSVITFFFSLFVLFHLIRETEINLLLLTLVDVGIENILD
jgi:hypothetical protein